MSGQSTTPETSAASPFPSVAAAIWATDGTALPVGSNTHGTAPTSEMETLNVKPWSVTAEVAGYKGHWVNVGGVTSPPVTCTKSVAAACQLGGDSSSAAMKYHVYDVCADSSATVTDDSVSASWFC